jgi:hypothetical protein
MPPSPPRLLRAEESTLRRLSTPARVQAFLDDIPYSTDPIYRSPRRVLADRAAHCFDGALLAAAALRRLGHRPLIVDLRAVRDDDHILALYRRGRHLGAVAKSNFVGLRFREPIFRDLRELVLSYFEDYYNSDGEKTLRSYSVAVDLARLDHLAWEASEEGLDEIARRLDAARHVPIVTQAMIEALEPKDERALRAGMVGTDPAGLYDPARKGS